MQKCPYPEAFQAKMHRLGWGDWIPTPSIADESNQLWISIANQHFFVCSIDAALAMPDDALEKLIEAKIGMTFDEATKRHNAYMDEREA